MINLGVRVEFYERVGQVGEPSEGYLGALEGLPTKCDSRGDGMRSGFSWSGVRLVCGSVRSCATSLCAGHGRDWFR